MSKSKQKKNVKINSPPVAVSAVRKVQPPKINAGGSTIRLHRKEFVGTATNGTVTTYIMDAVSASTPGYDINPTCSTLFPWLSGLASNYERFRFNSLSFEFVPSQPTTAAGRYYAAVDYDYDDAVASSKTILMGNSAAVESQAWQTAILKCDPASLNRDMPYRYCSYTTRGLYVEARTMFAGYLMIAFDGVPASSKLDIWVEYDIELVTPVLDEKVQQYMPVVNVTSISGITVATGTGFAGGLSKTTPVVAGPIRPVTSSTDGAPTFIATILGGSRALYDGLDLSMAGARGVLEIVADAVETGVTPASLIGTKEFTMDAAIFDSAGTWLGVASAAAGALQSVQPYALSALSTASAQVYSVLSVGLAALQLLYPAVRYIVPYYTSVAAVGAGNRAFGFRYNKD